MRGSEIVREKKEFEELWAKNERKRKAMSGNYVNLSIVATEDKIHSAEIQARINELQAKIQRRKTAPWKPEPALCKKFKVLDPYEHKPFEAEESEEKPRKGLKDFVKGEVITGGRGEKMASEAAPEAVPAAAPNDGNKFFKEVQASFMQEEAKVDTEMIPQKIATAENEAEEKGAEEQNVPEEQQLVVSMEKRPEMSLFQSIFDE